MTKTTTLTGTYLHSFGVHEFVVRDSNAFCYVNGASCTTPTRPNPAEGIVNQFYPEAVFKQNQFIVNVNAHFSPNFGVTGFYNFTVADSDGGSGSNPSNSYNLSQDYGRASWVSRNMVFLMANYQGPWGLRFNPFLIAQSGKPFNITTTNDLTGDNFFNDRPAYAGASDCPSTTSRYLHHVIWLPGHIACIARAKLYAHSRQSRQRPGRVRVEPARQPRHWNWSQALHRAKQAGLRSTAADGGPGG